MTDRLAGRVALITGAGSGLGRAMAQRIASEGASVMCSDMNIETARDTAAQIAESGGRSAALELDVTDGDAVGDSLGRTLSELGGLEILVNNAGIGGAHGWGATVSVNLSGVYHGLLHGAPMIAERGGGAIINIASVAGLGALVSDRLRAPEGGAAARPRRRVRRREARRRRPDAPVRDQLRATGRPDQRDLPSLHLHADDCRSDGRPGRRGRA